MLERECSSSIRSNGGSSSNISRARDATRLELLVCFFSFSFYLFITLFFLGSLYTSEWQCSSSISSNISRARDATCLEVLVCFFFFFFLFIYYTIFIQVPFTRRSGSAAAATSAGLETQHVSSCWYVFLFFFFFFIYYTNFFQVPFTRRNDNAAAAVMAASASATVALPVQQGSRRDMALAAGLFFIFLFLFITLMFFQVLVTPQNGDAAAATATEARDMSGQFFIFIYSFLLH